jgi:integrase
MMIRVEQGKGKKDRYTLLSEKLLPELRAYWCKYRPGKWLFPIQKAENHMYELAAQKALYLKKSWYHQRTRHPYAEALFCYPPPYTMEPIFIPFNDSCAIHP